VDGRTIGVLAGPGSDPAEVAAAVVAAHEGKLLPLVISDNGAPIGDVAVQRTLPATRSVEFDALVVAAGRVPTSTTDLLLAEASRHAKGLTAWGDGHTVLDHAGCSSAVDGAQAPDGPAAAVSAVAGALSRHRVWDR
jgi:catalase